MINILQLTYQHKHHACAREENLHIKGFLLDTCPKTTQIIDINEIQGNSQLATGMCRVISKSEFTINEEVLYEIIKLCEDSQVKVDIIYKYLKSGNFEEEVITEYLDLLSDDYQKITVREKNLVFPGIPTQIY